MLPFNELYMCLSQSVQSMSGTSMFLQPMVCKLSELSNVPNQVYVGNVTCYIPQQSFFSSGGTRSIPSPTTGHITIGVDTDIKINDAEVVGFLNIGEIMFQWCILNNADGDFNGYVFSWA